MTAYLTIEIAVTDPVRMAGHRAAILPALQATGVRPLVLGQPVQRLEGDWHPAGILVLAFDNADHARHWYEADGFHHATLLRHPAISINAILVDGFDLSRFEIDALLPGPSVEQDPVRQA